MKKGLTIQDLVNLMYDTLFYDVMTCPNLCLSLTHMHTHRPNVPAEAYWKSSLIVLYVKLQI